MAVSIKLAYVCLLFEFLYIRLCLGRSSFKISKDYPSRDPGERFPQHLSKKGTVKLYFAEPHAKIKGKASLFSGCDHSDGTEIAYLLN